MAEKEQDPNVTEENAPKTFSLKIGDGFALNFTLDANGKPISTDNQQEITDPLLVAAIQKMVEEEAEKNAPQVRVGDAMLKFSFDEDGDPVTFGDKMKITNPQILDAIKKQMNTETLRLTKLGDSVADNFKGLPMRELIGGPLFAAAEAQEKLASIAWDYYQKIAYETDENGNAKQDTTRLLKFKLERPVVEDGVVSDKPQIVNVSAPFIGLVPIPSLLIDRIDMDFQMEVTDTNTTKDQSAEELSTSISSKWFGVNVGISGKVSSSRENTRSTNQTAKYQVHVTASQQPQTEGLSKLMDVMATCIEPIPADSGK